ncbi:MAG: metallophosphoesterase [Vicinamibacteria bacterium]
MSQRSTVAGLLLALAAIPTAPARAADTTLVATGATWKYRDDGSNQGTAWRAPSFNDSGWASGAAQLGYGDGDEATVVGYGPSASAKYITTYFRHAFTVANPSAFANATLRLMRDDGAVVYLNGAEVLRSNMPTGTIGYTTPASSSVSGTAESAYQSFSLSPSLLVAGTNVLAVEVHQESASSSDVSFALELVGSSTVSVTRGPYLQAGTPTSIVARWRTSASTDTRVTYGTAPGSLTSAVSVSGTRTEHEAVLTNLQPATKYYYAVGSTSATLASGSDQFFWTPPAVATSGPTRVWVIGDSGTADASARAVRDSYDAYAGTRYTDVWLMLGDNAYDYGTDAEYQAAVFDIYPKFLKQTVLWPTIGNHDSADSPAPTSNLPYHQMFTLPKAGEAGGVPSGTEDYYSFDHANIHFVCLDSMTVSRSSIGAMATWLAQDLASHTQDWTIAYWHHPPYTKGTHDSDTAIELVEMRQNILPILEANGVDLVLAGHSHSYERSFLIDGHYGTSSTFTAAMKKDGGSGREGETGAYKKATAGPAAHEGAVYVVAGTSGSVSSGALNHPAMFVSFSQLGSLVLDVSGPRLDATFVLASGAVGDRFTMLKGSTTAAPAAPSGLVATASSTTQIDLGWTDNAGDETGYEVERSADGVVFARIATLAAGATSFSNASLASATTYHYRVRATGAGSASGYSNVASATTLAPPSSGVTAAYDATLRTPRCAAVGTSCDSGTLLNGRGSLGPESGQPNTVNGTCADGASGSFHADESNDRIRVSTVDGTPFAPGKVVKVDATVWAYSTFTSDRLDVYQAANAASPSWTLVATLAPAAAGAQVLSATYTLPAGTTQAVRARFRYQGSASPCGTGSYDDHDDLVFAVGAAAPDFGVSVSPAAATVVRGAGASAAVSVTSLGGFASPVSLAVSGLPAGVTAAFSVSPVTPPADASGSSTLSLTAGAAATTGTFPVTITGTSGTTTRSATLSLTVASAAPPPDVAAAFDAALRAPKCATAGRSCDSGTLLTGRGALGPETGQPNTIAGSCADGGSGAFHSDESNDRLRVSTLDGSALAPGKTVRVEATVWAYSDFTTDRLDLYQTANASSPSWALVATLAPTAAGSQVLSATYVLPTGGLQAVRARFRYQGSASPCGTGSYDDHDDLVFAVGP